MDDIFAPYMQGFFKFCFVLLSYSPMEQMPFNEIDNKLKIDRRSSINKYSIMEGFPLNPNGRTGIIGKLALCSDV